MGKTNFQDLTGRIFGRLKVIERDEDYISPNGYHLIRWKCVCECGNEVCVLASDLRNGDTKSCGCYKKEELRKNVTKDLTGMVFGRLTVMSRSDDVVGKNGINNITWLCLCSCGNEIVLKASSLNQKRPTLSCGCLEKDVIKKRNLEQTEKLKKELIGKEFGRLFVIKMNGYKKNKNGKKSSLFYCKCECGNFVTVVGTQIKNGSVKSCGCLLESYMASFLKKYFEKYFDAIIEYGAFKNPKTGKSLYFDIYLPNEKVFIEIHGKQHYEYNGYYHKTKEDFLKAQNRDKVKKKYAQKNGLYIEIDARKEISEEEVLKNIILTIEKHSNKG